MAYFGGVGVILVQAFGGLLLTLLFLRLFLPLLGTPFRNPICQFVYRATNPVLGPMGKVVPSPRGVSVATIILCALLCLVVTVLCLAFYGLPLSPVLIAILSTGMLLHSTLSFFLWSIIGYVVLSLVQADRRQPVVEVVNSIALPVVRLFRTWTPRLAAIDLSPFWATLIIAIAKYTLDYFGLVSVYTSNWTAAVGWAPNV